MGTDRAGDGSLRCSQRDLPMSPPHPSTRFVLGCGAGRYHLTGPMGARGQADLDAAGVALGDFCVRSRPADGVGSSWCRSRRGPFLIGWALRGLHYAGVRRRMTLRPLLIANFDVTVGGGEVGLIMLGPKDWRRGHAPSVAVPGPGPLASHLRRHRIPADADRAGRRSGRWHRPTMSCTRSSTPCGRHRRRVEAAVAVPIVVARSSRIPTRWTSPQKTVDAIICNSYAIANRFSGVSHVHVVLTA